MNERLDFLEGELSVLKNTSAFSKITEELGDLHESMRNTNATHLNFSFAVESRLHILEAKTNGFNKGILQNQVEFLVKSSSVARNGISKLRRDLQEVQNKTVRLQKVLESGSNRVSNFIKKEMSKELLEFKNEIHANCMNGLLTCSSPPNGTRNILETIVPPHNNFLRGGNVFTNYFQGAYPATSFWDCRPLYSTQFPNVIIERHDMYKAVSFSCAKNAELVGHSEAECRNREWIPSPPPICVSNSTYPDIDECAPINIISGSPLLMSVDSYRKRADFFCSENLVLKGPSHKTCTFGSWFPVSVPECTQI